jgi:hypothetical protein
MEGGLREAAYSTARNREIPEKRENENKKRGPLALPAFRGNSAT